MEPKTFSLSCGVALLKGVDCWWFGLKEGMCSVERKTSVQKALMELIFNV
jgi:hypothetical protein|tara:strand:+ start:649 stop:798 length:150 start_codon:yes stop_codon:yes gene_type:complete